MICAYSDHYIDDAMSAVGAMLDFAVNVCGEPLHLFYARFMSSGIASQISTGNPRYLCGHSEAELAMEVARRTGNPLEEKEPLIDIGSPEYWAGWTMTYIQWYLNLDFSQLQDKGVGIDSLISRYAPLHEADLSKSVQFAHGIIEEWCRTNNPLRSARKKAGLTQRQLATKSNVSLRSIRAYEQGQLSLESASAVSLQNLSQVLGCRSETLLVNRIPQT